MTPSGLLSDLRARSAEDLRHLLSARPDVAAETPTTLDQLARLLVTRTSVQRAVHGLTRAQLDALERAVVFGPQTLEAAESVDPDNQDEHTEPDAVIGPLRALALVVGSEATRWDLAPGVAEALGRYPAGLGRPFQTLRELSRGPRTVANLDLSVLSDPPGRTGEVLATFRHHPLGVLRQATRDPLADDPQTRPIDWLLARSLLIPVDAHHVELPREVGLALHHGDPWADHADDLPTPAGRTVNPRIRDNAARAAAPELVRDLLTLRAELRERPLATLQAGGVGVRERRRLAAALNCELERVDRLLGYAHLSGLIRQEDRTGAWLPTPAPFESLHLDQAYGVVLTCWWDSGIVASAAGVQRGDGTVIATLSDGCSLPDAVGVRRAVVTALARAADIAVDPDWLHAAATWLRPRLASALHRYGVGIATECADLGLTGAGAATDLARVLADDGAASAAAAMATQLPAEVDTVRILDDHTAVAHGPLSPSAAADLRQIADPEGRGAAAIFRFSVGSLQRGLESGMEESELRDLLDRRSEGPVPRSLAHVVEEAVRTHGALRIHDADQVITGRTDLVEAVTASGALAGFQVVRIGPEIAVVNRRQPTGAAGTGPQRDPVRQAVLRAAEQAGVQPTTTTPVAHLDLDQSVSPARTPAQLTALFPRPTADDPGQRVDPDHVRAVAQRLAEHTEKADRMEEAERMEEQEEHA